MPENPEMIIAEIYDKSTIESALSDAIKIWELRREYCARSDEEGISEFLKGTGPASCTFCKFYYKDRKRKDRCIGCPIMRATGKSHCANTIISKYIISQKGNIVKADLVKVMDEVVLFTKSLIEK